MSWVQKLCEVYDACTSEIGKQVGGKPPLLPIFHMTIQAHIEVMIDSEGNLCQGRARVIEEKSEQITIAPCTEKSAGRTSLPVPHPLFDKLAYLAGDFERFTGESGHFDLYKEELLKWCSSPYANPDAAAILAYLSKGKLIQDLIDEKILYLDDSGLLAQKWGGDKKDAPAIFRAATRQKDAFVRFVIVSADGSWKEHSNIWEDPTLHQSWIQYQLSQEIDKDLCYATGKYMTPAEISPKYIRRPGDGAKLISANDSSGFTYRGRFAVPEQAFRIGRETTEKAHNALRWLIARQGIFNEEQVILAFGDQGKRMIQPHVDTVDLFGQDESQMANTGELFADRLRKAIYTYEKNLTGMEQAVIMGMDAATPGRLSIFYYEEMTEKQMVRNVISWHETCRFIHQKWKKTNDKEKPIPVYYKGVPALRAIALAAYGQNADKKLVKNTIKRLLPCIVNGAPLPYDILHSVFLRAVRSANLEDWEERIVISTTCSLTRKYYNDRANNKHIKDDTYKEVLPMYLDENNNDRNYLWGRLLAYAQEAERNVMKKSSEKRPTNAERLRTVFTQHPGRTWMVLRNQLQPYMNKLGKNAHWYTGKMLEIEDRLYPSKDDNAALNELFIFGYASQMEHFREEKEKNIKAKNQEDKENEEE